MYEQFFHLEKRPFSIAPDPGFLYLSDRHRDALAHLKYGIESDGGFVLVSGEVGTGKTTLLRNLITDVPGNIDVVFLLNPRLTVRELLQTICDELGIDYPLEDQHSVKPYIDRLNKHLLRTHEAGRSTVMVIDEAQNLSPAVLEQLRLLTNLETDERKLLRIILVGQPELNDMLNRNELRQLRQRITARYHLGPLDLADTRAYLSHRLSVSGGNPQLFSPWASWNIHRLAGGIPRLINVIADRSLLGAYVDGKPRVDLRTTMKAARETLDGPTRKRRWPMAVAALLLAGAGGWWLAQQQFGPTRATAIASAPPRVQTSAPSPGSDTRPAEQAPQQPAAAAPAAESAYPSSEAPRVELAGEAAVAESVASLESIPAASETYAGDPVADDGYDSLLLQATNNEPPYRSQRRAFQALFDEWSIDYNPRSPTVPCDFAVRYQLQCNRRSGDWAEVETLDVPVVLEFRSASGRSFYATARRVRGDQIELRHQGETTRVSRASLTRDWPGTYIALWPMPSGYRGALVSGARDAAVVELRKLLGVAMGQNLGGSQLFDSRLETLLMEFQSSYGIEADGIVGPVTWLFLHRAAGYDLPSLAS
ncbi:MAG: AAA family ATPase [Pseudomonadota bacterium]